MSKDHTLFVPPERYPSPPKNMGYERPAPVTAKPKPIFPWEDHRPQPTRVFPDDSPARQRPNLRNMSVSTGKTWDSTTATSGASTESSIVTVTGGSEPVTPTTPTIRITSSDPWIAFTRSNAWDEVPEIERYMDSMQQKHRRTRSVKSPGVIGLPSPGEGVDEATWTQRGSLKLTDFPTKDERPSLPVTPAPIRRPKFWGGGSDGGPGSIGYDGDDENHDNNPSLLPAAEGVPEQTHWVCFHGRQWSRADCLCDLTNALRFYKDPVAQLQKLARQHSDALLQKLGGTEGGSHIHDRNSSSSSTSINISDLPLRSLPFGSEALISPTYVAPTATRTTNAAAAAAAAANIINASSSSNIVSPQPVKGSVAGAVPGDGRGGSFNLAPAFLRDVEDLDTTPLAIPSRKVPTWGNDDDDDAEAKEAMVFTDPGPALKKGEIV